MRPRKLYILLAAAILIALTSPLVIRSVRNYLALRAAKHVAMKALTPDDSAGAFDQAPVRLELPEPPKDPQLQLVELEGYRAWVPKPLSATSNPKLADLQYEKFSLRILSPMEYNLAKAAGMKDDFAVVTAAHHATRKGINDQKDIAGVKLNVALLAVKSLVQVDGSNFYYAEFTGSGARGFLAGDITKGKKFVNVTAFPPHGNASWTFLFRNKSNATMTDITNILSAIRLEDANSPTPSTTPTTTTHNSTPKNPPQ